MASSRTAQSTTTMSALSSPILMISSLRSCSSTTTLPSADIVGVRKHISRSIVTFTGGTSISLCASTFVLARFVSAQSPRRHQTLPYNLCPCRQSVGNPLVWTLSLVFPRIAAGTQAFWSLWTVSARWCILLLYQPQLRPPSRPVSSSTTSSGIMACRMRSSRIVIRDLRLTFGSPRSVYSERVCACPRLTIHRLMVRPNE